MKKLNLMFTFSIACLFVFSSTVNAEIINTNKNGIIMTQKEINNLKNLGFSFDNIDYMDEDIFFANKDIEATLESQEKKYIETLYIYKPKNKLIALGLNPIELQANFEENEDDYVLDKVIHKEINEKQYNNGEYTIAVPYDVNPHVVGRGMKTLTTSISYISASKRYRLTNELIWKESPKNRYEDLYGIAGNPAQQNPVSGSQNAYGSWDIYDTCSESIIANGGSNYTSKSWYKSSFGYGINIPLPENYYKTVKWDTKYGNTPNPCKDAQRPGLTLPSRGSKNYTQEIQNMKFTMYYDVIKVTGTSVDAFGSYQHAVDSITFTPSISVNITNNGTLGGIFNLDATYSKKFDGMEGTHAQILNPKW